MDHKGKRLFITGIPTSGKTYLAELLAKDVDGRAVCLDDFREGLAQDARYRPWTNFYLDRDEKEYLTRTSPDEQWKNLVAQSEGLWPAFVGEISKYRDCEDPVIFECVNILPHLAKKDLEFPGIVLIGSSSEEVLERNKKNPRWGKDVELQELEAQTFFEIERPRYKSEGERFGYPVFSDVAEARVEAIKLLL